MFVNISNGLFVLRAALLSSLVIHAILNSFLYMCWPITEVRASWPLFASFIN